MAPIRRMRATTIRFGEELWHSLEHEAELAGVSIAQYIREAVVTRLAYAAGRRGEEVYEKALTQTVGPQVTADQAQTLRNEAAALRAQNEQALRQTERLGSERR